MSDESQRQLTELASFMQMHTGLIFEAYERGRDSAKPLEGSDRGYYPPLLPSHMQVQQLPPYHVQVQQLPQRPVQMLPPASTSLPQLPQREALLPPVAGLSPTRVYDAAPPPDSSLRGLLLQILLLVSGLSLILVLGLKVFQLAGPSPPFVEVNPAPPLPPPESPLPPPAPSPSGLPPLPE